MPRIPRSSAAVLVLAALLLVLAACAPATAAFDTPAAREVERSAEEAFHRMELGRLQLGVYTRNALVDLDLPRGARVTVEAFSDDDYTLRFTSDAALEIAWLVTPRGVQRVTR